MKIEDVQALVAIANDEERGGRERLKAFEQADDGRKALKVGWSKLGLSVEQVQSLKDELPALAALDAEDEELEQSASGDEPDNPEPEASEEPEGTSTAEETASGDEAEPFEASAEELAAQAGRPKTQEQQDAEDAQAIERAGKKVSKAKAEGAGETRGGLTRLVESLLMDPALSYLDIINAVIKEFPKANTSARSIASVAAGMRRKGKDVPMRRPAKAEKPAAEPATPPNGEQQAQVDAAEA